jgi:4-hydroxyphenylacetaldehyde oxime monooxygenase
MGAAIVEFSQANMLYCFDWALPEGTNAKDLSMEEEGGLSFHRKVPHCLEPIRNQWQQDCRMGHP